MLEGDIRGGVFDRALYQCLPQPLARAYRKAYNSATPKDLHDNALSFALCYLRMLSCVAIASLREMVASLREADRALVEKLVAPSEGHWRDWLVVALPEALARDEQGVAVARALAACVERHADATPPELADATSRLLSYITGKQVIRRAVSVTQFLDALIRYRNAVHGHGAPILDSAINQELGGALLSGVAALARSTVLFDEWKLAYVHDARVSGSELACQLSSLEGPEPLRVAPRTFPIGTAAPAAGHVVLFGENSGLDHIDLHPLAVFSNDEKER